MASTTEQQQQQPTAGLGRSGGLVVLLVISLAQLMITLDSTIVSVALPSIQHSVGLSNAGRQWAVTAYTVAFGGLLLLSGRIGDLIGRKRAMLIGVSGFALASAIGGAAVNPAMLLSARALQGMFAACIAPSTLGLLNTTFSEPAARARAFSVYAAAGMSGGALGLVVGGALTNALSWRWCLFVNIPIAVAVLIGGSLTVPAPPRHRAQLDVPGVLLSAGGMVSLIYALGEAGSRGWHSPVIVAALLLSLALFIAFVVVQARAASPLLPLRIFTNRNSGAGLLAMAISAFTTYGMLLGMTYQLQVVLGYSPLQTGLAFMAYVLTAVLISTQVGTRLVRMFRPAGLCSAGLLIFAVALFSLLRLSPHASYPTEVLPALLLFGIGVGTLTVPAITTVMKVTDPQHSGVVSAVVNTAQQVGGSIGAALLNTISLSAAAGYLATHSGGSRPELAASVHGFQIACMWSAGIAIAGAIVVGFAVNLTIERSAKS
jgi:EmrB/QacA subfamily drug resistance transporter